MLNAYKGNYKIRAEFQAPGLCYDWD